MPALHYADVMGGIPEIEWDDWQPERETLAVFAVLTAGVVMLWWDFTHGQAFCRKMLDDCATYLEQLAQVQIWGLLFLGIMLAFLAAGGLIRLWEEIQERPDEEEPADDDKQ